jgi:hypothetical protein
MTKAEFTISQIEDDLPWKLNFIGRQPQNIDIGISQQLLNVYS